MRVSIVSLLITGLFAPLTLAAPTKSTTLSTPHGPRPAENVHFVPEGGEVRTVGDEIHLIDANGKVLHVAPNTHQKVRASPAGSATAPLETGWIAYASWSNPGPSPINHFTTTWNVPSAPADYVGQTVYLFNSIEPGSGDAILQPVLQYGPSPAGGGEFWSVTNWWLVSDQVYFSTLIDVSVGQALTGVITLTGTGAGTWSYTSTFTGLPSSQSITATSTEELVWATETLEFYDYGAGNTLSLLPTGGTSFYNIDITTTAGVPSVSWFPQSDIPDEIICTVNSQGATNAVITITY